MEQAKLLKIAETIDQLVRLDIPARGVIGPLYEAARRVTGVPLSFAAADLLCRSVKPGDTVIIATGWIDQPVVAPGCGESDGPPGAVALARAVRVALRAAPVIVTDACLVEGVKQVARAAGFQCVRPEEVIRSIEQDKLITTAVLPFSAEREAAAEQAAALIDGLKPAACIAVERGGVNGREIIHNMAGYDTGAGQAQLDQLFRAAGERKIATLAIGDGGNEIGMGNIAAAVKAAVPYGGECRCGCGGGIAAATAVDVLLTAAISNWGAYGVAAMLGAFTGCLPAINDARREKRVLEAAAAACFHDPITGAVEPGADGCGVEVHVSMVSLIQEAVCQGGARL